jgi:hypothetical protein
MKENNFSISYFDGYTNENGKRKEKTRSRAFLGQAG